MSGARGGRLGGVRVPSSLAGGILTVRLTGPLEPFGAR